MFGNIKKKIIAMPIIQRSDALMGQAESLVRSVFRWMTPIERFSFVAIKHPTFFCFMVEGLCRGLEE